MDSLSQRETANRSERAQEYAGSQQSGVRSHDWSVMFQGGMGASSENTVFGSFLGIEFSHFFEPSQPLFRFTDQDFPEVRSVRNMVKS